MDVTTVLRVAQRLSLAAWFGGSWMGAVSLNSATLEVDDHFQRTRVANAGWFRWAPIVGLSLLTEAGSAWALGRFGTRGRFAPPARFGRPALPLPRRRRRGSAALAGARVAVTAGAVLSTAGTGLWGQRIVRAGDVPVADAVTPIAATPDDVAAAQRRLKIAQWLVPACTGTLIVLEVLQERR